jgi:hypothetical protein
VSIHDCVAVGRESVDNGFINSTLVESWNGTGWSVTTSPNPDVSSDALNGVSCAGPSQCWAAGDRNNDSSQLYQTLVELGTDLSVTSTSLHAGTPGHPYSATLAAAGGAPPYTWTVASGPLPDGLSLDALTGVISGTPTQPGTSSFSIGVTDSGHLSATAVVTVTIL